MRKPENESVRRFSARQRHNAEFVRGLLRRHKDISLEDLRSDAASAMPDKLAGPSLERVAAIARAEPVLERAMVLETIVSRQRPVLFVQDDWLNTDEVTVVGEEAKELIAAAVARKNLIAPLLPLVGRIDATHFPNADWVGTGWLVAPDVVVTNRHVASLISRWDGRKFTFRRGVAGAAITSTFDTLHEFDDLVLDEERRFAVTEVLYIEPESGPYDIAFLKVARQVDGTSPTHIEVAGADLAPDSRVLVVGYPARAPKSVIPDHAMMHDLFRGRYDVKRAAPGYTMIAQQGSARHDCTTLGGNSGSVVLDLATGQAVGLHYAGLYQEANYAVPAAALKDYVDRRRWSRPPQIEVPSAPPPAATGAPLITASGASITVPLTITFGLGGPSAAIGGALTGASAASTMPARVTEAVAEAAAKALWGVRPDGVLAVRLGYPAEGDRFGDQPFIAASVAADQLAAAAAAGPATFQGVEVRYVPAEASELVETFVTAEAPSRIAYDDDARTGEAFSFDPVDEPMTVLAHVGPEYSWDVLADFLDKGEGELVSAIYEFHAPHIFDKVEQRLQAGVAMKLVMDNATFHGDEADDRPQRFAAWAENHAFERIVAPEGATGLISSAYHIKVTVRQDDHFWLSSGNWKQDSSQPVVTQQQRDEADVRDIPGNREWHVVVGNATLARRFRSHILQDFARSEALGGGPVPKHAEAPEIFLDIPIEEGLTLERPPPGRVLQPKLFKNRRKVRPLLTPDREGAVFAEAVLELIHSARESLLFQIPYIGMPSAPGMDRGYIDELIKALTHKLKTLDDARVILRQGGQKYSSPTHAAWHFKSKGVDIANRLRVIDNHHTKGMIVDCRRVLIGSHNWSQPGVTLNRDASLLFDDAEIAAYYTEAFEIDWDRARPVRPKKFARAAEAVFLETSADAPERPGYRRVSLTDLLEEE